METPNAKHAWFRLSHRNARLLLRYMMIMIVLSLLITLVSVFEQISFLEKLTILNKAIIGSMATSMLGSSIYYSRKLYRACINHDMVEPATEKDMMRQLGIMNYFLLRPLFAIGFAVLTVLLIKSGVSLMSESGTANGAQVNENFVFIVMAICFFVGYSSGDFIDALEVRGKKLVGDLVNKASVE